MVLSEEHLAAGRLVLAELGAVSELSALDATDGGHVTDTLVLSALAAAQRREDHQGVEVLAEAYGWLMTVVPGRGAAGAPELVGAGTGRRRSRGAFATPQPLARALARAALPNRGSAAPGERGQDALRVIDPACGPGALLKAAAERLMRLGVSPAAAIEALHGVDLDPVAVALCRARLGALAVRLGVGDLAAGLAERIVLGDALDESGPEGLQWALAFPHLVAGPGEPDPVTGFTAGFDAVIANPPWERLKVHARDWAEGVAPQGLREGQAARSSAVRTLGRHPLTGAGEINAHLPFAETCWRLLAPHGRAGLLVPAGIATDRSAGPLVRAWLEAGALESLDLLAPDADLFPEVSAQVSIAVVALTGGGVRPKGAAASVCVGAAVDAAGRLSGERWELRAETAELVNPNTGLIPPFGSAADAELVVRVHRAVPVLVRRGLVRGGLVGGGLVGGGLVRGVPAGAARGDSRASQAESPWEVRLISSLHMTNDAKYFHHAPGLGRVPLWEAKHAGLLDPWAGLERAGGWRYWVDTSLVEERFGALCERGWLAGYRNVTTTASPRTLLPSPLPIAGVGNSMPLITAPRLPLLLAALASVPVDYLVRQKHAGANLNFFKLEQTPVPEPSAYDVPAPWSPHRTIGEWVLTRFATALAWGPGLEALASELGVAVPLDGGGGQAKDLRARAFADLDAAHALMFGFTRSELSHVLGTFGALNRRDLSTYGRESTSDLVLAAYDDLVDLTGVDLAGAKSGSGELSGRTGSAPELV